MNDESRIFADELLNVGSPLAACVFELRISILHDGHAQHAKDTFSSAFDERERRNEKTRPRRAGEKRGRAYSKDAPSRRYEISNLRQSAGTAEEQCEEDSSDEFRPSNDILRRICLR